MAIKYIIGIDEAGRGPLAGPVAVAAVAIKVKDYDTEKLRKQFLWLNDSKKVTPKRREVLYESIKKAQSEGLLSCSISFSNNQSIDAKGIVPATHRALDQCLSKCTTQPSESKVILDGGLRAVRTYRNQETIIKGDEKEPLIMLASILAKVSRDRLMIALSKEYPQYGFERHKGYGTKAHYEALKKHGLCPIHRRSFLRKLLRIKK